MRSALPRVAGVLVYALLLHWSYHRLVAPSYGYQGMSYRSPDLVPYVGVTLAVLAAAVALPARINRVSDFILWVVFLVTAAPSALLAQYMETLPVGRATLLGLMVLLTLVLVSTTLGYLPRDVLRKRPLPPKVFFGVLTAFALTMYLAMIVKGSLSLTFLSFSEVYEVRATYKATLLTIPLFGYLISFLYAVVNPVFVAFGIYCRRWLPLLFGALGQALVYLVSGQKLVLMFVAAALAVAVLYRKDEKSVSPAVLAWALSALVLLTTVVDLALGRLRLTPVFLYRLIVLPASLTAAYVWVFDRHPRLNFSTVVPFFSTDFYQPVPPFEFVGRLFNNAEGVNANVNFFGDGYMHYGYTGMLVEGLVLVLILWATREVTRDVPLPLACIVFLIPTVAITNGSALTAVLTFGFGAGVVVSYFLPTLESFPRKKRSLVRIPFRRSPAAEAETTGTGVSAPAPSRRRTGKRRRATPSGPEF